MLQQGQIQFNQALKEKLRQKQLDKLLPKLNISVQSDQKSHQLDDLIQEEECASSQETMEIETPVVAQADYNTRLVYDAQEAQLQLQDQINQQGYDSKCLVLCAPTGAGKTFCGFGSVTSKQYNPVHSRRTLVLNISTYKLQIKQLVDNFNKFLASKNDSSNIGTWRTEIADNQRSIADIGYRNCISLVAGNSSQAEQTVHILNKDQISMMEMNGGNEKTIKQVISQQPNDNSDKLHESNHDNCNAYELSKLKQFHFTRDKFENVLLPLLRKEGTAPGQYWCFLTYKMFSKLESTLIDFANNCSKNNTELIIIADEAHTLLKKTETYLSQLQNLVHKNHFTLLLMSGTLGYEKVLSNESAFECPTRKNRQQFHLFPEIHSLVNKASRHRIVCFQARWPISDLIIQNVIVDYKDMTYFQKMERQFVLAINKITSFVEQRYCKTNEYSVNNEFLFIVVRTIKQQAWFINKLKQTSVLKNLNQLFYQHNKQLEICICDDKGDYNQQGLITVDTASNKFYNKLVIKVIYHQHPDTEGMDFAGIKDSLKQISLLIILEVPYTERSEHKKQEEMYDEFANSVVDPESYLKAITVLAQLMGRLIRRILALGQTSKALKKQAFCLHESMKQYNEMCDKMPNYFLNNMVHVSVNGIISDKILDQIQDSSFQQICSLVETLDIRNCLEFHANCGSDRASTSELIAKALGFQTRHAQLSVHQTLKPCITYKKCSQKLLNDLNSIRNSLTYGSQHTANINHLLNEIASILDI